MIESFCTLADGPKDRLTQDEADALASRAFLWHDHRAQTPQQPIYWVRQPEDFKA